MNEPTNCEKISKAALLRLLPPGTDVTLIFNTFFGDCNKHRRVVTANRDRIVFAVVGGVQDGQESHHSFSKGTEVNRHDEGFTIAWEGKKLTYLFGHRTPQDRTANTGKPTPTA